MGFRDYSIGSTNSGVFTIIGTRLMREDSEDKSDIITLTNLFRNEVLRMQSSTGDHIDYEQKGTLKLFNLDAFYNKNTAANILAFHTMSALDNTYMVYNSRVADCFRLIYQDGKEFQFQNFGDGLYTYVDPKDNFKLEHMNKRNLLC